MCAGRSQALPIGKSQGEDDEMWERVKDLPKGAWLGVDDKTSEGFWLWNDGSRMCPSAATGLNRDDSKCSSVANDCCACDSTIGHRGCGANERATCRDGYIPQIIGPAGSGGGCCGLGCEYSRTYTCVAPCPDYNNWGGGEPNSYGSSGAFSGQEDCATWASGNGQHNGQLPGVPANKWIDESCNSDASVVCCSREDNDFMEAACGGRDCAAAKSEFGCSGVYADEIRDGKCVALAGWSTSITVADFCPWTCSASAGGAESSSSSDSNGGAIAGGVIGGLILLVVVVLVVRSMKKKQAEAERQQQPKVAVAVAQPVQAVAVAVAQPVSAPVSFTNPMYAKKNNNQGDGYLEVSGEGEAAYSAPAALGDMYDDL